jgi:hypothetical protein
VIVQKRSCYLNMHDGDLIDYFFSMHMVLNVFVVFVVCLVESMPGSSINQSTREPLNGSTLNLFLNHNSDRFHDSQREAICMMVLLGVGNIHNSWENLQ